MRERATLLWRRGDEGRVVAREWKDQSLGMDDSGGRKTKRNRSLTKDAYEGGGEYIRTTTTVRMHSRRRRTRVETSGSFVRATTEIGGSSTAYSARGP